jgi:predicted membrane protein
MTSKEISAWVMVIGAFAILAWLAWDASATGLAATQSAAAWKMLWAIGYVIGFNILATIVGVILVSIFQREEVKDERADERDKLINGKAMGAAYFVLSIGVLGVLIWQALGLDPSLVPYTLFGISMLAGVCYAITQIVLYRVS